MPRKKNRLNEEEKSFLLSILPRLNPERVELRRREKELASQIERKLIKGA